MYWVGSSTEYHDAYLGIVKESALLSEVTYLHEFSPGYDLNMKYRG